MGNKFAAGKWALAECDICGFRYPLHDLKEEYVKLKKTNILACRECWSIDHPQLQLGMYPVTDNMALENPRPDSAGYYEQGNNGAGGSRMIFWGWNPVGGGINFMGNNTGQELLIPNSLVMQTTLGTVTATGA